MTLRNLKGQEASEPMSDQQLDGTHPARSTGRLNFECGDKMLRSYLYEAANVLLTRVANGQHSKLGAFGLQNEAGYARPRLRLREKLAVILHRMWIDGTEFKWSSKEAAIRLAQPARLGNPDSLPLRRTV
jgi:hypothetical protein